MKIETVLVIEIFLLIKRFNILIEQKLLDLWKNNQTQTVVWFLNQLNDIFSTSLPHK